MKIQLSSSLVTKYPEIRAAFLLLRSHPRYGDPSVVPEIEDEITRNVRRRYPDGQVLASHYLADAYRKFYEAMGLSLKKVSTPLKQAARFLDGTYRSRGKPIDVCMDIEYVTGVSFQLYDAATLPSSLCYDVATAEYECLDFHSKPARSRIGEVILHGDGKLVHCPSVGNNKMFSLNEGTTAILIRVLGIPGLAAEDWTAAVSSARMRLEPDDFCELSARSMTGELDLRA